jgi:exportin-2 (importin alpha re-exporter)
LLTPTLWEARGNVPALVRLLRAFMERGAAEIVRDGRVAGLLGVFQHLIKSKANDVFGFELLESLIEFIPL